MKQATIEIANEQYKVLIADKDEDRTRGLQGVKSLPENKGMLFVFDDSENHQMWMKDTLIPLQQIFIDKSGEVLKTVSREPLDEELIGCPNTKYVLEVNPTDSIEEGDFMEGIDGLDDDEQLPVMKVLAPDGTSQMDLYGGERIFSRKNTKVLIKQAKKAYKTKSDSDYSRLGKSVFKYIDIQNNNQPEYVDAPK